MNGQRPRTFAEEIRDNLNGRDWSIIFVSVLVATISAILVFKNVFGNFFINVAFLNVGLNAFLSVLTAIIITRILIAVAFFIEIIFFGLTEMIMDLKNRFGIERLILIALLIWSIYTSIKLFI